MNSWSTFGCFNLPYFSGGGGGEYPSLKFKTSEAATQESTQVKRTGTEIAPPVFLGKDTACAISETRSSPLALLRAGPQGR